MHIAGYGVETLIKHGNDSWVQMFTRLLELVSAEIRIDLQIKRLEVHDRNSLVERTGRRSEHTVHHVPLGAREDEVSVITSLDIRANGGLHRIVIIAGDLLELVNRYQARLVSLVQICKNLIQSDRRIIDGTKPDTPGGYPVHIKRNL